LRKNSRAGYLGVTAKRNPSFKYIIDFLLDFCLVKDFFEIMGDLSALFDRSGTFLQQCSFEFATPVLLPAHADNENGMAYGKPQKDDEYQGGQKNEVLFKHGHSLRGCSCVDVGAVECLVSP